MNTLPEPGSIWAHDHDPPRRVVRIDEAKGRLSWDRPGKRPRWVKLDSWARFERNATQVVDWPAEPAEAPAPPPTEVPAVWMDLGGALDELHGVLAPGTIEPGPLRGAERDTWRRVVSECLARGVRAPAIADATRLPYPVVTSLMHELREQYKGITAGMLAHRKEQLYFDTRRIYDEAMRRVTAATEPGAMSGRDAAALLKAAVEAQKRMAMLIGADQGVEGGGTIVQVNNTSTTVQVKDPIIIAAQRFGIDPLALAAMGDVAAEAMTEGKRRVMEQDHG